MADLERDYGLKCRNTVELGTLAAASRLGANIGTKAYDFVKLAETTLCLVASALDALCNVPANVAFGRWRSSQTLSDEHIKHTGIDAYATNLVWCFEKKILMMFSNFIMSFSSLFFQSYCLQTLMK